MIVTGGKNHVTWYWVMVFGLDVRSPVPGVEVDYAFGQTWRTLHELTCGGVESTPCNSTVTGIQIVDVAP